MWGCGWECVRKRLCFVLFCFVEFVFLDSFLGVCPLPLLLHVLLIQQYTIEVVYTIF